MGILQNIEKSKHSLKILETCYTLTQSETTYFFSFPENYLLFCYSGPRFPTPVEQLFAGTLRNQVQCSTCSAILINYERFRELNLGIKKPSYDRRITLEDLLDDYFGNEVLTSFNCNKYLFLLDQDFCFRVSWYVTLLNDGAVLGQTG